MIEVSGLRKTYGDFAAVVDSDFAVDDGEVFGIVGPNGAGKTTTLKVIAGLVEPTDGEVTVAGFDASDPEMRRHLGFLPEESPLYEEMTALSYLRFFADLYDVPREVADERIEGPVGNITVNSTHFSGTTIHFPTNEALHVSAGPAPVSKGRRHRKFQFTGCMFHGHGDAEGPVATVADTRQAAFVGTQWLLWQDDGVVVRLGSEDARWPTATTTFSHCRFSSKPDSTATGVRCENVEAEVPCLQVVASTFERMAHAVDWGGQQDKRASWAGNGVETSGAAHVGARPVDADVSPF